MASSDLPRYEDRPAQSKGGKRIELKQREKHS